MGTKILVGILIAMAVGALGFAIWGWRAIDANTTVQMGSHVFVAMTLGIVFSLLVGVGLMALVFLSSRRGFDDRAGQAQDKRLPKI